MKLTKYVTDNARGFFARRAGQRVHFPHRVKNAGLHRFLTIANTRQCAILDGGNRILEILGRRVTSQWQDILEAAR